MSWLSEFSEKAENILNSIDKNAALVLNKSKNLKKTSFTKSYQDSFQDSDEISNNEITESLLPCNNSESDSLPNNISSASLSLTDSHISDSTLRNHLNIECLQNEIQSLNNEISLLLNRVKLSEQKLLETSEKLSLTEQKNNTLEEQFSNFISFVHSSNDIIEIRKLLNNILNNPEENKECDKNDQVIIQQHYTSEIQNLMREKTDLEERLRTKEDEIIMLKSRISQKTYGVQNDVLESRLRALTLALIQKQSSIESLTIEKTDLISKLNTIEGKYQEVLKILNQSRININYTDDVKAQIPFYKQFRSFNSSNLKYRFGAAYSFIHYFKFEMNQLFKKSAFVRMFLAIYIVVMHILVLLLISSRMPDIMIT